MCRFGLDLSDCRGQAYDGAANMSGRLSGVQARISADYPKALCIRCFCHSLNLAVQDVLRNIELIQNTLDIVFELSKLIHYSSKRKALLENIRQDFETHGSSLRPLCPTRWTVKYKSLESVERNYAPLLETLEDISTGSDSSISCYEVRSKAAGIFHSMQTFNTFFGMMLGVKFYGLTDILNCTLQGRHITAFDAKGAARAVCQTLLDLRSDTSFITFWEDTTTKAQQLNLCAPALPRTRRPPRRVDSGSEPTSFSSPTDYYRKVYFDFIDSISGEIIKRFEQENYNLYAKAEQLLLRAAGTGEVSAEYCEEVCDHYGQDLDHSRLRNQLAVVHDVVESVSHSLHDIKEAILSLNTTSTLFF